MFSFTYSGNNLDKNIHDLYMYIYIYIFFFSVCFVSSDCADGYVCFNVTEVLIDLMTLAHHENEIPTLQRKAKISLHTKECIKASGDIFFGHTPKELTDRLKEIVLLLRDILGNETTGVARFGMDFNDLTVSSVNVELLGTPLIRQAGTAGK